MKHGYRNIISLFATLLLIFAAGGCRNDIKWSRTQSISPDGWLPEEVIEFNLDPAAYQPPPENRFAEMTARAVGDTLQRWLGMYHAYVAVRYLNECNVADLALVAEKAGLDEPITTDTLRFRLFNQAGRPLGRGRLGINEARCEIYPFKVANGTTLSLRPAQYTDTVTGITDITLILSPSTLQN